MFDRNDHDSIRKTIDSKKPDAYVIPVYVQIYKDAYKITELKEIKQFNPAGFRVGFGAKKSIFDKHSLPECMLRYYTLEDSFVYHNEDKQTDDVYMIFSTAQPDETIQTTIEEVRHRGGDLEVETFKNLHIDVDPVVMEQVIYYYNMLKKFLADQYQQHRKKLIEESLIAGTFTE